MPDVRAQDGVTIHYEVAGSGEPVLLMHGALASVEWWKRSGLVDRLVPDCTVVLLDFRGHGLSDKPHDPARYGLTFDAADAIAVLDAVGIERVTACGWSWGGSTGLLMASLHPDRVTGVLAIGSSGHHVRFTDVPGTWETFPDFITNLEQKGMPWVGGEMLRESRGLQWTYDEIQQDDPVAMIAWARGQMDRPTVGRRMRDLSQPITFVAGEHEVPLLHFPDPVLPLDARYRVLEGENHVSAFLRIDVIEPELRELIKAAG